MNKKKHMATIIVFMAAMPEDRKQIAEEAGLSVRTVHPRCNGGGRVINVWVDHLVARNGVVLEQSPGRICSECNE